MACIVTHPISFFPFAGDVVHINGILNTVGMNEVFFSMLKISHTSVYITCN